MTNRLQRLLLAARDAGSAGHVAAMAANFASHEIESLIVAEGVAHSYLESRSVPHMTSDSWLSGIKPGDRSMDIVAAACEKLAQFGACAVVCGRSPVQEEGIDRIAISAARMWKIPSFVIQDFWGDVWPEDYRPDHYLVIDELAAHLTRNKTFADVHVIGSPKHAHYEYIDFHSLRRTGRAFLELGADASLVGFFGQDLLWVPGYRQVLRDIGETVKHMHGVELFYKPHPRETPTSQLQSMAILEESGVHPIIVPNFTVEEAIASADVVLSCFSTVALDAAFMMRCDTEANVSIVCSDYPGDVSSCWRPATGLDEFPLVSKNLALSASDRSSLEDALRVGLLPEEKMRQAAASRLILGSPRKSIDRASELITRMIRPSARKFGN